MGERRAETLTAREIEVLTAYCEAQGAFAAATRLGIAESTVKNTLANVRSKLGVSLTSSAVYLLRDRLP